MLVADDHGKGEPQETMSEAVSAPPAAWVIPTAHPRLKKKKAATPGTKGTAALLVAALGRLGRVGGTFGPPRLATRRRDRLSSFQAPFPTRQLRRRRC